MQDPTVGSIRVWLTEYLRSKSLRLQASASYSYAGLSRMRLEYPLRSLSILCQVNLGT